MSLHQPSTKLFLTASKIDTLLRGHPLVATGSHRKASINGVKIVEWDVYNDGKVIVHGVEEFFDPAFQTLRYPWFDDNNGGCGGGGNNESKVVKGFRDDDFRVLVLMVSVLTKFYVLILWVKWKY
ncbi:hypothetical protein Patl1_14444 [Pistacia atlantica]|uniref:Uncharacterized protein n=1 Tax=Pistacia atlantica TaxID=434234 RepID=A0ACC1ARY8_9ROSI|nr:hypothetical protein Patl1_14444 [Pistacia atlantica]